MISDGCSASFVVFCFLWRIIPVRGDADVSCVFMERCILPCSFQSGFDGIIHWFQVTERDLYVHSFYLNKDQLGHQDQRFRNRTSVFNDQISRGNASLQLTGVKVQDQGRYKCHTSTIRGDQDSFINLKVDALVHEVNIQQVGNRITCSSEGIYPKPELIWSTSPPSGKYTAQQMEQQTHQHLYNISSFLLYSHSDAAVGYSCTVSTRRNRRTATWRQLTSVIDGYSETTISCSNLSPSLTSLTWRFNHSQTILTQSGSDGSHTVSEGWKQHVKDVSESGSLTLQDLSSDQEGTYTCELSDAEETHVINTFLKIHNINDSTAMPLWVSILIAVTAAMIEAFLLLCLLFYQQKKGHQKKNCKEPRNAKSRALTQLETVNADAGEDTTTAMLHHRSSTCDFC
ncbi:V-set domain-containing T-cell activation inhibitor 1-like [Archocentrus centrarchus]|uniref:V-set domain-containing T-cell activation inhibitor 1-like n=1 Tax=Archocentrus centrarchus TaxID=63155 RepID=UPI0011E9FB5D|nr:V-set domain-containing T-cell activation inhibitor 1-like [Archocentrus centrarchus]